MNIYLKSFITILCIAVAVYFISISYALLRLSDTMLNIAGIVLCCITMIATMWAVIALWIKDIDKDKDN